MTSLSLVALPEAYARELADPLRRQGFDAQPVPVPDAVEHLKRAGPDLALVHFSASTRDILDEIAVDADLAERMAVVAVLDPVDLPAYESGPRSGDFILWPVAPAELGARLRLAVRRVRGADPEHLLRFGDLSIDLANYRVTVAGQHVQLTFKEYELLRFLAANRDKVFTREQLLNRVWGYDYYGGARTVDVHIRRLRAKIEEGHYTYIETIRNVGYRFREGA